MKEGKKQKKNKPEEKLYKFKMINCMHMLTATNLMHANKLTLS